MQAAEIHLICKRISHIVLPAEGGRMAKSKEKKDIVEKEFADLCNQIMDDMISGKWKKGMYRDMPCVLA